MKQILFSLIVCMACCNSKERDVDQVPPLFAASPIATPITPGVIDEASGIADSRVNDDAFWVHEDSNNPTDMYLYKHNGSLLKKIFIKGAQNRDWEDMAVSSGPIQGTSYIYLADIGDNNSSYSNYTIYRFPEPKAAIDTVSIWDKITFEYPDGAHDAEAMLVDERTKDIYIITKRNATSKVYKLAYPQSTTALNTATFVTNLSFTGAVSAAASINGQELIIKTYTTLFYWTRKETESIDSTLIKTPVKLAYKLEPQGEAVSFKNDNSGFFTLSELGFAPSVSLNFYKRL